MADSTAHLDYRADIDGLRAIAVLSVIAFHAFPSAISGGFIGVDIFFVISGYLITGIIFKTIADRTFSFANFYTRRIVRLFPALIVVLTFSAAFGWFNLLTEDYKNLGRDIAAAVGFVSNFVSMHDGGYFDRASDLKPLLHLWSLGVEEQFYLLWPAIVFILFRSRAGLGWAIFATLAISFVLNVWHSIHNPLFDFYSPVTRFWELMIGTAIAFVQHDPRHPYLGSNVDTRLTNVQSAAGLCCVVIAAYCITEQISFPGWWALLPAIGTALIIAAGSSAVVNRTILGNRLLVGIGLISYPLYLWHWPLLAFATITKGATPAASVRVGLIGLSIVLALLTYLMVERPVRLLRTRTLTAAALCFSIGFVGIFGASVYSLDGVSVRFPIDIRVLAGISDSSEFFKFRENIRLGICHDLSIGIPTEEKRQRCVETRRPLVFLWGDSYAATLYPGLKHLQETNDFGIGQLTHGNAPPFFERNKEAANDADVYALNVQKLEDVAHFRPELIIFHWNVDGQNAKGPPEQQVEALADAVRRVAAASPTSRIAVIGPVPTWEGTLIKAMVSYWENSPTHDLPPLYMRAGLRENIKSYDDYMKKHVPPLGVLYISALDIMCNSDGCLTRTGRQLTDLTAIDFAHLTKAGSEYLAARFSGRLWELIDSSR